MFFLCFYYYFYVCIFLEVWVPDFWGVAPLRFPTAKPSPRSVVHGRARGDPTTCSSTPRWPWWLFAGIKSRLGTRLWEEPGPKQERCWGPGYPFSAESNSKKLHSFWGGTTDQLSPKGHWSDWGRCGLADFARYNCTWRKLIAQCATGLGDKLNGHLKDRNQRGLDPMAESLDKTKAPRTL